MGIWVVVLEIHPFLDGNGRLSRVLTTLLLLQAAYAHVPYSSLESVIEQSKEAYYLALRQTRETIRTETPNWQPWLVFFLRALMEQVRRLNRKVEREQLVLATLPDLSLQMSSSCGSMGASRWAMQSPDRWQSQHSQAAFPDAGGTRIP